MKMKLYLAILLLTIVGTHAWNNGLARTPPMGWLSWLKFACTTDCSTYPKQCINEQLYKDMVDKLASDGYLALGYNTVNIDDCWMEKGGRDPITKRLIPEKHRFPSGIKSLADYAHSKKVQLGIYEDIGKSTCAGYPGTFSFNGSVDYTEVDAMTFSDWGVDSLKLDGCNANHPYKDTYQAYSRALGKQKHKIVFGCSWPLFDQHHAGDEMYKILHEHCHLWRNYNDIEDSWRSVKGIIEFYRMNVHHFLKWHGPGSFFDPDMLIIGNDGLSYEQSKSQMAFWCLWSAPLLMSNDLRDIKPEFKAILQNKHLIAVNQDPLAVMGHVVVHEGNKQMWVKKLSPAVAGGLNSYAVLYFNDDIIGPPAVMSHQLSKLIPELKAGHKYDVHDLFDDHAKLETLTPEQSLTLRVPISGSVRMVKLVPHN